MTTEPFETTPMDHAGDGLHQHQLLQEIMASFAATSWQSTGVPIGIIMSNLAAAGYRPSREIVLQWLEVDEADGLVEKRPHGRWAATPILVSGGKTAAYDYEFRVWAKGSANAALVTLCQTMAGRIVMEMTETEFGRFRQGLGRHGLELREITRTPHADPEIVP